jgi:hypothetical protein
MNRTFFVSERRSVAFAAARDDAPRGAAATAKAVCDTAQVDVENWVSVRYWADSLGVSEAQLLRAIREVGVAVERLELHFAAKGAARRRRSHA